jgi:hypothetical protein
MPKPSRRGEAQDANFAFVHVVMHLVGGFASLLSENTCDITG